MGQERACERKVEATENGRMAEAKEYAHRVDVKADQAAEDREQAPSKRAVDSALDRARGRAEAGEADAAN
ncbi:uncharacterized protein N7477_007165 [Penicillium maclennaniae]|uniref:uncharacterized protein n=1 Tax=Penicillium maclennaniae TaxID=1343394 RepID=UPI002540403F|nr:uncharacterized protein N7477_007165 [Penicillium maclennaniae]KAJ5668595.1 hypothetical protein N7477_007165 [Penicillium maclennaniae]